MILRFRAHALIFLCYLLLACLPLWALVSRIGQVVPGGPSTDYYHFIWNYWWMGHALEQGISPWYSDFVLFPFKHNLSLHTLTPIWLPVYQLLEPFIGRVATLNLFVLLSVVLNGFVTYHFVRRWSGQGFMGSSLAFGAGAIFALQPYVLYSATKAHLNIIGLWWIPLSLIVWRELVEARYLRRWISAILLAFVIWGCLLTDLQYVLFLPQILGFYILWTLWQQRRSKLLGELLAWGVLSLALLFGLMWIWPLPPLLKMDTGNPYLFPPAGIRTIVEWAIPLEALWGLDNGERGRSLGVIFPWIVWLALLLSILRMGRVAQQPAPEDADTRPPLIFWLVSALPSVLLMLGAQVVIFGLTIKLPYRMLHELLNGQYRTPERFVIPAVFSLVIFSVLVWASVLKHVSRRKLAMAGVVIGALLLVLDLGAFNRFPTRPVKDYAIYEAIGQEDADYVIFDVPVGTHYGWTSLGEGGQFAQFYAPVHQKRVVNGFLARMPYPEFAFFVDSPMFRWLALGGALDSGQQQVIQVEFERYLGEWPIGYVFAHRQWMNERQQSDFIGWLNSQQGLCDPQMDTDTLLIWWRTRVVGCDVDPVITTHIDLGSAQDWLHIGAGWYPQEDIAGTSSRWLKDRAGLRVNLDPASAYEVQLRAFAFQQPRVLRIGDQRVEISSTDWANYTLRFEAGVLDSSDFIIEVDSADSPASLGLSDDTRVISVAIAEISFIPVGEG